MDKNNRPTEPMKEALKKGAEALQRPERAEYARQEIFDFLNKQYETPTISNTDNIVTAIAKREVIFSDPFKQLWDKIKAKTRDKIDLSDDMFNFNVLVEVNSNIWAYVNEVKIVYEDADINVKSRGVYATSGTESSLQTVTAKHRIPDLLRSIGE